MVQTLERRRYGLVIRRRHDQCLVIDGPAKVHFLAGECEALIIHDVNNIPVTVNGQSITLSGPALIVWIRGSGRVGIDAAASIRVLRGELLGGLFVTRPLLAGLACRTQLDGDGPVLALSTTKAITHIKRTDEGLMCPK